MSQDSGGRLQPSDHHCRGGPRVRTRLLSPREAGRLMGLGDDFWLSEHYNSAYHVAGDGLVAPVVRYLAAHVLEPLADAAGGAVAAVA